MRWHVGTLARFNISRRTPLAPSRSPRYQRLPAPRRDALRLAPHASSSLLLNAKTQRGEGAEIYEYGRTRPTIGARRHGRTGWVPARAPEGRAACCAPRIPASPHPRTPRILPSSHPCASHPRILAPRILASPPTYNNKGCINLTKMTFHDIFENLSTISSFKSVNWQLTIRRGSSQ